MQRFKKHLKVWWLLTTKASQIAFTSRFGAILFIFGKLIRFVFFLFFIIIVASRTKEIAGYSFWEIVLFFATFNLIDVFAQFFLREVYRFRWYIISGNFDFYLVKPLSPLFRCLFGGSDPLDIPLIFISIAMIFVSVFHVGGISILSSALYFALVINALIIALAFHVFVLAVGVLTTEVDNTIWLYRDLTQMGRFPIDIYREPLRAVLTFAIPVGVMMTFPGYAILGLLSPLAVFVSFLVGIIFLSGSLAFWRYSLRNYSSASS